MASQFISVSAPGQEPIARYAGIASLTDHGEDMTDIAPLEAPVAHVTVVYLGPVAPHWEVRGQSGDRKIIDDFRARVMARLVLLPPHDPQFRRNRERVVRDAERENIGLRWDLGFDEGDG